MFTLARRDKDDSTQLMDFRNKFNVVFEGVANDGDNTRDRQVGS